MRYFPWVSSDTDVLVIHDNERSHEKASKGVSTVSRAEIGPEAFKRPLLTHRNVITTGWKRVGKMSRDNTKARESILEEIVISSDDEEELLRQFAVSSTSGDGNSKAKSAK